MTWEKSVYDNLVDLAVYKQSYQMRFMSFFRVSPTEHLEFPTKNIAQHFFVSFSCSFHFYFFCNVNVGFDLKSTELFRV